MRPAGPRHLKPGMPDGPGRNHPGMISGWNGGFDGSAPRDTAGDDGYLTPSISVRGIGWHREGLSPRPGGGRISGACHAGPPDDLTSPISGAVNRRVVASSP